MARSEYEKVDQGDADEQLEASDAGSADETLPRTSGEVRRRDQETLTTEEEAEKLLHGRPNESRSWFRRGEDRQDGRPLGRKKKERRKGEKRELMYEMEEGGPRSSSAESSGNSSEVDLAKLGETQARRKAKASRFGKFAVVHVVIVAAFLALLYGAYRASQARGQQDDEQTETPQQADNLDQDEAVSQSQYKAQSLSNGTHTFAPTTILISLDGFRADFLHRNLTPTLSDFIRSGVSPKYMNPSFPSLTFPNHFTLVTGLHPESHGVVGNSFWDPKTQKEFYYTDPGRSMQPEWWNAEPLWETAELQGLKTAVHMWPGSEAHIGDLEPAYVDHFNGDEELDSKVNRILSWLDMPGPEDVNAKTSSPRPQLIAAYVPDVDADGHLYGPNSTYIRSTIAEVDGMLGQLFRGMDDRNLTDIVNVVVVSDHGMATTSVNRLIQLEDILDTSLIEHTDGWPLYGLRPYDHTEQHLHELYNSLIKESKLSNYKGTFDVYLRDENMPARYHFANNPRIAPLWIVPKPGWAIVTRDEFDVAAGIAQGLTYDPRGLHGYDNQHPLMRAIFLARGPAFPHMPGSQLEPFQNTEVYNIVCDSLGITPVRNNGTLRLPLKPSGLHNFDEPLEVPEDLQDDESLALPPEVSNLAYRPDLMFSTEGMVPAAEPTLPPEVPNLANRPDFVVPTAGVPPVEPTLPLRPTGATTPEQPSPTGPPSAGSAPSSPPAVDDHEASDGADEPSENGGSRWWSWVTGKLEAIKGWAGTLLAPSSKDDKNGKDG